MEIQMDPQYKQILDDVFDAFTMLSSGGFVSLMHVEGGFTRYSRAAVELFGLPGEYIPNGAMDWNDYLHPEDRRRYMDVMIPLLEGKTQTYDITYRVHIKSGEYVNFRAVGAVLRGSDGKPSLIGGAMYNQGRTENIDPVTVLPNRNTYLEDLSRRIAAGQSSVSLQIGISRFSEINQLHGYTYGNRILQEIAWLLQDTVKDKAIVYRTDGAAFILLFDDISRDQAAAIYDHIRYCLQRGIEINGIRTVLSSNGGLISSYSTEVDANTVWSCMNYAYEESKQRRHGELVDFNGSINYEGTRFLEIINAIRSSILMGCKGFHMEYQPVIASPSEHMNGAEATVCWEDPRYGRVAASDFLPVLERDFIFEELVDFILRQSLSDGVRLLEKDPNFLLCVNAYRIQLEADYFIDNLVYFLEETGFPPHLLSLKISSDCRWIDPDRMRHIIQTLHAKQILIIIDDFGSGSDSIGFLKNAPVDAVCVAESFIRGIEESARDRDILEHLTRMASTCVPHINVKGVDSVSLRDILRQFPVTTMQGRYYSAPLTYEQLVEKYYS